MFGLQQQRVRRNSPSEDPVTLQLDFECLSAALYMFGNWTQAGVYDMYIQQLELKNDFVNKRRGSINSLRFQAHCQLLPLDLRDLYDINMFANTRHQQRQELQRIDNVIEDALCFWATSECE